MQTLEMKALLLAVSFCLVAALQAQDSSSLAFNNVNVSQRWATGYSQLLLVQEDQGSGFRGIPT